MHLVDSHCHLGKFAREGTLDAVLERAAGAGVGTLVCVGTGPEDWAPYRALAVAHAGRVHHTAGLHPCSVEPESWRAAVDALPACFHANDGPKPVALGEIGLDYFHLPKGDPPRAAVLREAQLAAFRAQLALAGALGAPVIIHSREAFDDCVAEIDASGVDWRRVVFHCFSEGAARMRELLERGGRASFTGVLTYPSARDVREAALAQGLGRFVLETDSPYLAPQPVRGKTNEPAHLLHTARFAAELFGVSLEKIAETTTSAAREFYGI
ncbi:MAG: TatD family hydrolase [Puniceicoccales bacterium]|jgi:TatD DNase family protein|nr:TatD family hydrolase [Puniceicoccales bacterium]